MAGIDRLLVLQQTVPDQCQSRSCSLNGSVNEANKLPEMNMDSRGSLKASLVGFVSELKSFEESKRIYNFAQNEA